jgi:hypothetical protein
LFPLPRTVFWSWQSDAPQRETRNIIQDALKSSLKELAAELEEAERLEVDQGAKGVVGLDLIAEVILGKIDTAVAVVADITTVAVIGDGLERKCVPNPNVMLELGYARRSRGRRRIIPVFNRAIGPTRYEDLPFDLRHMSGSISFDLPVGASRDKLRQERSSLQRQFTDRLRAMFASDDSSNAEADAAWKPHLPHDSSIWADAYNPLPVAVPRMGQVDIVVPQAPRMFVRVIPKTQGSAPRDFQGPFPGFQEPLLPIGHSGGAISGGRTGDGHAIFENVGEDRTTKAISRWYKDNGEIWSISAWSFYKQGDHPHFAYDEAIKDLVHWLQKAVRVSRTAGGAGPFRVVLGAAGLRNVMWWHPRPSPGSRPFLGLKDAVSYEAILRDDRRESALAAVSGFIDEMTDNFGVAPIMLDHLATLVEI